MKRYKIFKNEHFYLTKDEIGTIIYIFVLVSTFIYGIATLDFRYDNIVQKENAKYRTGAPPEKIDGVVIFLVKDAKTSNLGVDWRIWMHEVRQKVNRTEILVVTSEDISWYPIGPVLKVTNCSHHANLDFCMFEQSLQSLIATFSNFKWVLVVDSNSFVNVQALNAYLEGLENGYFRTQFLKAAVKQTGKSLHLDQKSGWFMSRRTAFEWYLKMPLFSSNMKNGDFTFEQATSVFLPVLGIDIKSSIDPHFVPHTKRGDDFADLIDDSNVDECPSIFRYFDMVNLNISRVREAVTWNLELEAEERRAVMLRLPYSSIRYGYLTTRTTTSLCIVNKPKNRTK